MEKFPHGRNLTKLKQANKVVQCSHNLIKLGNKLTSHGNKFKLVTTLSLIFPLYVMSRALYDPLKGNVIFSPVLL